MIKKILLKAGIIIPYLPKWSYPFICQIACLILTRKLLNLRHPKTFSDKINWLKFHDISPLKVKLSDKYLVKDWVKSQIGEKYVIKLLGVWDNFEDIDFSKLPDKFVLKMNHGCGFNYIVPDKSRLNMADVAEKFRLWMNCDYSYNSFEFHYSLIEKKIIAEEYIENIAGGVDDYKVWCFKGKIKFIQFLTGRFTKLQEVYYDSLWKKVDIIGNHQVANEIAAPENLEELINLAERLSAGFPFVRVDFYRLNDGSFKFGEMTFSPASGFFRWKPKSWDMELGKILDLPKEIV